MKKTELEKELSEVKEQYRGLENIIYGIKLILWDRQSYNYKLSDVLPEIKKRYEQTVRIQGSEIGYNRQLEEENRWLKETLELMIFPADKLEKITELNEKRRREKGY